MHVISWQIVKRVRRNPFCGNSIKKSIYIQCNIISYQKENNDIKLNKKQVKVFGPTLRQLKKECTFISLHEMRKKIRKCLW